VESLARIDHFDFDDTALAPAHAVNGMNADRTVIDKPRHQYLSHWLHPFVVTKKSARTERLSWQPRKLG
jgi:hypothetical protein